MEQLCIAKCGIECYVVGVNKELTLSKAQAKCLMYQLSEARQRPATQVMTECMPSHKPRVEKRWTWYSNMTLLYIGCNSVTVILQATISGESGEEYRI